MEKCGECVLGVKNGAICENCEGSTFVKIKPKEEEKKGVKSKK